MIPCIPNKAIVIADRGYEGYNVFAHMEENNVKYLCRVKDIDSTMDQSSGASYYIVTIELNETTLTKGDNSEEIKFGMLVEARMIVDTQRYIVWFFEKIFG